MTLAFALWSLFAAAATWWLFSAASGWATVRSLYAKETERAGSFPGLFGLDLERATDSERADVDRWKRRLGAWWLSTVVVPLGFKAEGQTRVELVAVEERRLGRGASRLGIELARIVVPVLEVERPMALII